MQSNNWKGWVYEHIYVAEIELKRQLNDDECVHHINMNKQDNHPENLMVLSRKAHAQLHSWLNNGAEGYDQSKCNKQSKNRNFITCLVCNKKLERTYNKKYCSWNCYCKSEDFEKSKILKIKKDELEQLIKHKPMIEIAKDYGVSDKTIKKWCNKWGIQTPPRGYWAKSAKLQ